MGKTTVTHAPKAHHVQAPEARKQVTVAEGPKSGPTFGQVRQQSSIDVSDSRPAPAGTLPEVRGLILKYKPNRGSEVERPAERVLKTVAKIDELLSKGTDAKQLAKLMVEQDLRTPLFKLEALLKLYEPELGHRFEKQLEKVKELEDQLGAVGFARDALGQAEKAKLPGPTLELLREKVGDQMKVLEKMVEKRWLPDADKRNQAPQVDELIGTLMDAKFAHHGKDQKYLRGQLAERLQKVADTKYDFTDLQGGVHELRRDLRWLPIFMSALDGAIQTSADQNPVPALKGLLKSPEAESPFLKAPPGDREPKQIVLSKSLMVAQSALIKELGERKDTGEYMHELSTALVESKQAKTLEEAEALVASRLGRSGTDTFLEDAKKAYGTFQKQGVLKALIGELEG